MSEKQLFLIVTPALEKFDAVSYDVFSEYKVLTENGYKSFIYSQYQDEYSRDKVISKQMLTQLLKNPSTTLIYHHSIYWEEGDVIFESALGKVFLKYHNITPAQYIENSQQRRHVVLGRWQTQKFIESNKISLYICDSIYNSKELEIYGADKARLQVSAPFNRVEEFEKLTASQETSRAIDVSKVNLLFVGRFVRNKNQLNLVKLVERYLELYGETVHLYLVGKIETQEYADQVYGYIKNQGLSQFVTVHLNATFEELSAYYRSCGFFVCLSEHEGFCVPLIEAQCNQLPLVVYDKSAVGETVGDQQIKFSNLDFDRYCAAISVVHKNEKFKKMLIERGLKNYEKYRFGNLSQDFLNKLKLGYVN